jgi:hypothetical protein
MVTDEQLQGARPAGGGPGLLLLLRTLSGAARARARPQRRAIGRAQLRRTYLDAPAPPPR